MRPLRYLENLETSILGMRRMLLGCMILSAVIALGSVLLSLRFALETRDRIYLLSGEGEPVAVSPVDAERGRTITARWHVRHFHELFFTLSPDMESIEYNVSRALEMADKTAYDCYEDLREQGYYQRLIHTGAIQQARVDSMEVRMDQQPYQAVTYLRAVIIRQSAQVVRRMVTSCQLYPVERSTQNPSGFLIRGFRILDSEDVEVRKR